MKKNLKSQLTKKQDIEIFEVYDVWMKSYLNGDIDTYGHYLDKDYHFVGSTAFEEFLNKADTSSFFEKTADQLSGKTDLRNNRYILEKFGDIVFLTHFCDAWFLNGTEWSYYSRFRCTNALHETKDGWRFIYQHYSTPDEKAEEGQTIGYQKISEENLQLREAIKRCTTELEEKNRELEIESALERVRSEALAMDKSSDLLDIVVTMRKEFTALGHEAHYFWHMLWLPDKYEKAMTSGDGTKIGMVMELPRHIHGEIPLLNNWEKGNEPTVVYAMDAEEAIDYVHKMVELGDFQQVDPHAPSDDDIRSINGLTFIMARTTHGEIGYSLPGVVKDPSQDSLQLLRRFARAFDFAHKRFQDLKRKEKQSREIEIELSLEKIRSRSMAMHTSDELADLSLELVKQVQALGVSTWFCAFNIYDDDEKGSIEWGSNGEGTFPRYRTPREGIFLKYYKAGQRGETLLINEIGEEECPAHYEYLCTLPGVGDQLLKMKKDGISFPSYQIDHVAFFKYGYIIYITYEPVPESHEIFKRFAKVFEQTYTRFLDLQKAETQAREAQIEAALERVRSKSMAMHRSDELLFVATIIFHELDRLGINTNMGATAISINIPDSEDMESYVCGDGGDDLVVKKYIHPYSDNKITKDLLNSRKNPGQVFVRKYSRKDKDKFYHHLFNNSELRDMSEEIKSHILETNSLILTAIASDDFVLSLVDLEGNTLTKSQTDILSRFSNVFKQSYTRFLDLQKAEKQARENQIEAALERVRSKTMAMHKSEDMEVTVLSLFDEVVKLGMGKNIRCGIGIIDKESNYMETFSATKSSDGKVELVTGQLNMGIHPLLIGAMESWVNGDSTFEYHMDQEELLVYYTGLNNEPDYPFQRDLSDIPKEEFHKGFLFDQGDLFVFSQYPINEEESSIFRRFTKVFQQSYTRFQDLLKAEKQAREAQVEAALEKVRSRTMGMQKSEELPEAANLLFTEIQKLGIPAWSCGYNILSEDKRSSTCIMSSEGELQSPFQLPLTEHESLTPWHQAIIEGKDFFVYGQEGKELEEHYDYMRSLLELKETFQQFQDAGLDLPTTQFNHLVSFSAGFLLFITYEPVPESHDIFKRFGKVFDQTYTRFLDLQKAEKQAWESRIEASLERVRAKAMAMHTTEAIGGAISVLFQEMANLGIKPLRCGLLNISENQTMQTWTTSTDGVDHAVNISGVVDMTIHPLFQDLFKSWKSGESIFQYKLEGKDLDDYYNALSTINEYKIPPGSVPVDKHYCNVFLFKEGGLFAFTKELITGEEQNLYKRFTKVFTLTYRRYQDLKVAEERTQEAVKQSSLDRVRGEIASMRTSEDLNQITPVIWRELQALEVPFFRCGVFIVNEEEEKVQVYLSTPEGRSLGVLSLGMEANEITMNIMKAWKKNNIYRTHWDKNEFINWTKSLMEIGQVKNAETYQGSSAAPESLNLHFVPFKQGMLYVGAVQQLEDDKIDLVKALAEAFSIAYARYEDFKKLEEAKNRIESTLDELKSAQKQLIQSEKMASLGELTAGIAHEIKNPLNFVNNFSEVSKELLVELEEELENGDAKIINELLGDVIQNLDKILHHGRRADSIVKGMLQHSRSNSGEKELTDINVLTEEYLNLAYHGLRAMDKSFNSSLVKNLDPDIPKVKLVSQEIGRVILNLVNNAFYAVNEKKRKSGNGYNPEVKVGTKLGKGKIQIAVEDNGDGIPQHVLDKIFQPFFTTKPTGQGTGLGLSLSYDIIKAHGGELKADTEEGKGTIFSILLPV